jgi:hypothetical protein
MAIALGAPPRWRIRAQSIVMAVSRQVAGQPAPQPGARGGDHFVGARLGVAAAGLGMDAVGALPVVVAGTGAGAARCVRQAGGHGAGNASAAGAEILRAPAAARGSESSLPSLRSFLQPGRHRTHAVAHGLEPSPSAAVESLQRSGAQPGQRLRCGIARHVVRARVFPRHCRIAGEVESDGVVDRYTYPGPVVRLASTDGVDG